MVEATDLDVWDKTDDEITCIYRPLHCFIHGFIGPFAFSVQSHTPMSVFSGMVSRLKVQMQRVPSKPLAAQFQSIHPRPIVSSWRCAALSTRKSNESTVLITRLAHICYNLHTCYDLTHTSALLLVTLQASHNSSVQALHIRYYLHSCYKSSAKPLK
ncbi:hypothetical protein BDR03DRAFT_941378 [Suillus americanus]|nr:hypothetical protein BDR03DRAFT_941378 [Suillus americanus]